MATQTDTRVVKLKLDASGYTDKLIQLERALGGLNKEAKQANRALDKLGQESQKANRNLQTIGKTMEKNVQISRQLNRAINTLRNVFATLFALRIAEGFISGLQAVDNQIRTVTDTTEEFYDAQLQLLDVANETRQSYEGTVKLYARIARANDELGLSQEQIVSVTKNVGKALSAQGASAQESRSVLLQLAQAFGSGRLAGEEFRAVAEGAPLLLQDLANSLTQTNEALLEQAGGSIEAAKSLGLVGESATVTFGDLKKLAADGKLTADVLAVAFEDAELSAAAFATTLPTLGQALTVLSDKFGSFVRDVNNSTGAFGALAKSVLFLADNIELLTIAVAGFAAVKLVSILAPIIAGFYAGSTAALVFGSSLGVAQGATLLLAGALVTLKGALLATGIGALVVGVGFLITKIDELGDSVGGFGIAFDIIFKEISARVIEFVRDFEPVTNVVIAVQRALDRLNGGSGESTLFDELTRSAEELDIAAGKLVDGKFNKILDKINAPPKNKDRSELTGEDLAKAKAAFESLAQALESPEEAFARLRKEFEQAAKDADVFGVELSVLLRRFDQANSPILKAGQAMDELFEGMDLELRAVSEGLTVAELKAQELILTATKGGVAFSEAWQAYLDRAKEIEANAVAAEQIEEFKKALEDSASPAEKFANSIVEMEAAGKAFGATAAQIAQVTGAMYKEFYEASDSAQAFKSAMDSIKTPLEEFQENIALIITDQKFMALGGEEQVRILGLLSNAFYETTAAGKALADQQERILDIQKEVNDSSRTGILANRDSDLSELDQAQSGLAQEQGGLDLSQIQAFEDERVRIVSDANQRIIDSGTEATQILGAAIDDFGAGFSDAIISAAQGSEDAFEDFAVSFISNIADMVIQMLIIIPLLEQMKALLAGTGVAPTGGGSGPTAPSGATATGFADGGAFGTGGSVVTAPTFFKFADGGVPALGVAGEAGAEGIFPLNKTKGGEHGVIATMAGKEQAIPITRVSGGKLGIDMNNVLPFAKGGTFTARGGIKATGFARGGTFSGGGGGGSKEGETQVNVVVNNQAQGVQVDTSSRQTPNGTELEIMVTDAVRSGMQSGRLDDVLGSQFGVRRRGM